MIAYLANGIFAECTTRQHASTLRIFHHLILVADQYIKIHILLVVPGRCCAELVRVQTNPPTLGRFLSFTAQGLGDQLVTKADAHQFLAALVQLTHKVHEPGDPGFVIVHTGFTAGDQIGIDLINIRRVLALLDIVNDKFQAGVKLP